MNTREEFEYWAKSIGLDLDSSGLEYCYIETDNCYTGWQACQALNDAKMAELEAKLKVASEALSELHRCAIPTGELATIT